MGTVGGSNAARRYLAFLAARGGDIRLRYTEEPPPLPPDVPDSVRTVVVRAMAKLQTFATRAEAASAAAVLRLLDQMALHKLNVFHWHLTDDQGWRIAVDSWPRLAVHGGATPGTYPQTSRLEGGYTVLEVPSREAAIEWAAKIAAACRCAQELRVFQYDPES